MGILLKCLPLTQVEMRLHRQNHEWRDDLASGRANGVGVYRSEFAPEPHLTSAARNFAFGSCSNCRLHRLDLRQRGHEIAMREKVRERASSAVASAASRWDIGQRPMPQLFTL